MAETTIKHSTTRQKVLTSIKAYIHDHQYPPTIREIMDLVGLSSTSVVRYHLEALRKLGLIQWIPGKPRTITIVKGNEAPAVEVVIPEGPVAKDEDNTTATAHSSNHPG